MPIDDPSPESEENLRPGGADLDDSSAFIDRDDETDSGFIDSDYEEDFPGNPSDLSQTSPDPGYAAFASELDDPLADWPSPDAELNELPEVRLAQETAASNPEPKAEVEPTPVGEPPENVTSIHSGPRSNPDTEDELPAGSELLFPDDVAGDEKFAYPTLVDDDNHANWQATDVDTHHDQTDRDDHQQIDTELVHDIEPASSSIAADQPADVDAALDTPAPVADAEVPLAADSAAEVLPPSSETQLDDIDIPPPAMGGIGFGEAVPADSDGADSDEEGPLEPDASTVPAQSENDVSADASADITADVRATIAAAGGFGSDGDPTNTPTTIEASLNDERDESDDKDEFVDDFLNDLDPPEEANEVDVEPFDSSDTDAAFSAPSEEPASFDNYSGQGDAVTASDNAAEDDSIWRKIPYGLVAVVILALALLAVGGFGVIQQRTEMQEEIRRLQSQLATTITPEQAQLEREQQRQIEVANESLGAEIEALNAENSELKVQLTELENRLEERSAEATARAEEQAREAARAEAARQAAQRAAAEEAERQRQAAIAATPAPAQTTTVAGGWFVNFGSYAQKNVADRWADRLRVEEGQVMVQTATAAGKTLYRVRVVGLQSQDQAERIATKLEREYQLPRLWVGKN